MSIRSLNSFNYRKDRPSEDRPEDRGFFILKPNCGCEVCKPSWNLTRTVVRFLPAKNPENPGQFLPSFFSNEVNDTSAWLLSFEAVSRLGSNMLTFITSDPRNYSTEVHLNPVKLLYNAAARAVRAGIAEPEWRDCIAKDNKSRALRDTEPIFMAQVVLMEHKNKPLVPPKGLWADSATQVFLMSKTAGSALLHAIEERDPKTGDRIVPDVTDLSSGTFVAFGQYGTNLSGPSRGQIGAVPSWQQPSVGPTAPSMVINNNYYVAETQPTYDNGSTVIPSGFSGPAYSAAFSKIRDWDEIIYIPSYDEQVELICNAGLPESLIIYALDQTYSHAISKETRARVNRKQVPGAHSYGYQAEASRSQSAQPPAPAPALGPTQAANGWGAPPTNAAQSSSNVDSALAAGLSQRQDVATSNVAPSSVGNSNGFEVKPDESMTERVRAALNAAKARQK